MGAVLRLVAKAAAYGARFANWVWSKRKWILRALDIGQAFEWIWNKLKSWYRHVVGAL